MAYPEFDFRYHGVQETARHFDAYTAQTLDRHRQFDTDLGPLDFTLPLFSSTLSESSADSPSSRVHTLSHAGEDILGVNGTNFGLSPSFNSLPSKLSADIPSFYVHTPSHAEEDIFQTNGDNSNGSLPAVMQPSGSHINHDSDDLSKFPTEVIEREDSPYVPRSEPVAIRRSKRQRKKDIMAPSPDFADEEIERKFEDEGDAIDDEYLPETPFVSKLKRARSTSLEANGSPHLTGKRPRAEEIRKPRGAKKNCSRTGFGNKRVKCDLCPQTFSKAQDAHRHAKHKHLGIKFVCCGVPYEERLKYTLFYDTIITMDGTPWIGGCGAIYSRQDALLRHLREGKGSKCTTPDYET